MPAHASNSDDHAVFAQAALGIVEKDVGFERAVPGDPKAQIAEGLPDFGKLAGKAQLDFDFELQSVTLNYCAGSCQWATSMHSQIAKLTA